VGTKAKTTRVQALEALPTDRVEEACGLALKLFLERGYDNTPMSMIAEALGLTKAGVYHHFESKEHLLYVIHRNTIERLLVPILDRAERVTDPEARLRTFVLEYATLLAHDKSARLLISEARRLSPEHYDEIRRVWRRGFDVVRTAILELQRQGRCKPSLNPTFAAFGAIGMCSWIFYWFDYSRPDTAGEVAATMADVFMSGVLAKVNGSRRRVRQ